MQGEAVAEIPAADRLAPDGGRAGPVRLELEAPTAGTPIVIGQRFHGFGWLLADSPVRGITVELDGVRLCKADTGLSRADLAEMLALPPGARPGFRFSAVIPARPPGPATLRLLVQTDRVAFGHETEILLVNELATAAAPVAEIEPLLLTLEEARLEAGGALYVRGWAAGLRSIQKVEVWLGERLLGTAETGISRADVAAAVPAYPNAALSGFLLRMPVNRKAAGETVTARVTDGAGDTRSASLAISVSGGPQAEAAAPIHLALEEAEVERPRDLRVRGWAVSLKPLQHVRVFLDQTLIGDAELGQDRVDVGLAYPDYPGSVRAGFVLRRPLEAKELRGRNVRVVATAAGGVRREANLPLAVPDDLSPPPAPTGGEVHFYCESAALTEDGALYVKGWAVCGAGVAAIDIELDDQPVGQTMPAEERQDVALAFPHIGSAGTSGFRFGHRLEAEFAGEHTVRITVTGRAGERHEALLPVVAEGRSRAGAAPAGEPLGIRYYLDTPTVKDGRATEVLRGFLSLNGWAFSRAGLTGVEVFVDGQSQGFAHHGIRREDLAKALDDKSALHAGFAMLIPPQVLKRGLHQVRAVMRDAGGVAEEIQFLIECDPSLPDSGPWALRRKLTQAETDLHRRVLAAVGLRPHFTVLLPCDLGSSTVLRRLRKTVASLAEQAWGDWTLALPAAPGTVLPEAFAPIADRVRLIPAGSATALADLLPAEPASLLMVLGPGDELGEDALLELALAVALRPGADFVYADERRIDPGDGEVRAFFKPDFSPDLLLSTNYIGRPWVATAALLARCQVRLGDLDRHGEYDLVLRLTEQAARIEHVAKVLCARGTRALDGAATERRALTRAMARRAIEGEVLPGCIAGTWRLKRRVGNGAVPGAGALVSIIIPTIAARGLVRAAIASIRAHTAPGRVEIVVLDNIPAGNAELAPWKRWLREAADAVIEINEPFNWSRFNNFGARAAQGSVLLFLNDDIEVLDDTWLDTLLEHVERPEVGAVGPQLLYADGKVQHAGMFLAGHIGRHAFRFSPADEPGPFGLALTQRNVISVTGACLMVRRDVFEELGGFDEQHSVINNDLDFCLRLRAAGRLVVYTPHVRLTHHEMASRAELSDVHDAARFQGTWADLFAKGDPYYSPHLALNCDDYVPEQEPVRQLHIGHPLIAADRVRRILALKLDHIGDFISAFPAFRRLKHHFPQAELTVLAAGASGSLVAMEPAIDRYIRFDFFHAVSEHGRREVSKKDLAKLQEQLAPYRFDLAVDLRRQPDTRPVLQHTGARWLAGFDQKNATRYLDIAVEWEDDIARTHKRTHVSEALTAFIDAVAAACEPDRHMVHLPPLADAGAAAAALPAIAALGPGLFARPVVAIHAGAGAENKQWPPASFAALIDLIAGEGGANAIIIGGPDEAKLAADVQAAVRLQDHVYSVAGQLNLRELPVLLRACALYVGNDSGPKHLAAALGVPTVGIHSGSVDTVEWGPLGPAAVAVRRETTCSPCYIAFAKDCHRDLLCLRGIRVGDVWNAARPLLALRAPSSAALPPAS
jgi:ADP-heptose:LPS heptosyltransferase/GT2 family glycosyltransferase